QEIERRSLVASPFISINMSEGKKRTRSTFDFELVFGSLRRVERFFRSPRASVHARWTHQERLLSSRHASLLMASTSRAGRTSACCFLCMESSSPRGVVWRGLTDLLQR